MPFGFAPDLVMGNVTLDWSQFQPGESVTVHWTVSNGGQQPIGSASTTAVRIISADSGTSVDVAAVPLPALPGFGHADQSATVTVPTTPGTYYISVIADSLGQVGEFWEANNARQVPFLITPPNSAEYSAELTRLYDSVFDRDPDADVLAGWVYAMNHGKPLSQVAQALVTSTEFKTPTES